MWLVSIIFRDDIGALQGSSLVILSHFAWIPIIESTTLIKDSYEWIKPCLPVSKYPSKAPSAKCSDKYESNTLPYGLTCSSFSPIGINHCLSVTSNTWFKRLLIASSGPNILKLWFCSLNLITSLK